MGFGVEEREIASWAKIPKCEMVNLPFEYLGLPVGAKPSDKKVWNKVVNRVTTLLEKWKNNFVFFGEKIVLINSVLSSIPLYFLLFFESPSSILNQLRKLQCHFLGGLRWIGKGR